MSDIESSDGVINLKECLIFYIISNSIVLVLVLVSSINALMYEANDSFYH
jgi:hypothetical protein